MIEDGYDLCAASGQIVKVEQKWANMVKSYKKWYNESNMLGSGADVLNKRNYLFVPFDLTFQFEIK